MSHFAESLKKKRQELNMTMQALADKAAVSKSMICKIECDVVQPTIDVAARIARALNTTLSEMLHNAQNTAVVFLPKEQQSLWEDANHITRRNISPIFTGLTLEWLEVELPAQGAIQKCMAMNTQGVEKYMLVTKGELTVTINQDTFSLRVGDSIYFDCSSHHEYVNQTAEPTVFYVVVKYP